MSLTETNELGMCPHSQICTGCSLWEIPYSEQLEHKKNDLKKKLNSTIAIEVISAGHAFLRTRFDFTVNANQMGLYDKNKNDLVDLKTCYQLTPALNQGFKVLRQFPFPIRKGSIRLRISPTQKLGLWLDFANLDIKNLLVEKNFLIQLSQHFTIEFGQKKKLLDPTSFAENQLKLKDPESDFWFQTKGQALKCAVSSFTQPSWQTADLITDVIESWLGPTPRTLIEFGSGIGQYTIPLLKIGHSIDVFESDEFALKCLKENAVGIDNKLTVHAGDFQKSTTLEKQDYDMALVNPPRSGLKDFTKTILDSNPEKIIYISCFPETLAQDAEVFLKDGYQITQVCIVDQFPQTHHYEACVLFQRVDK